MNKNTNHLHPIRHALYQDDCPSCQKIKILNEALVYAMRILAFGGDHNLYNYLRKELQQAEEIK